MIDRVEKLLNLIDSINKVDDEISDYRFKFEPEKSWVDIVKKEIQEKYIFTQTDKNNLRHAIETLETLEIIVG